ncbi:aminoimidazole riboside kinase [Vibrio sp. CAU 1672]|uniref:aminoimidazole riboside kinase n=1 Tax=Vibrio sp. CAU 1672 TaxID=3032594 RepID=UPI0023DB75A6|nr:aminoimidazole riboside kinase [Vibrio sp. CAU 1672]MDF2153533.1 aminoimidazole riboside kinase [Vibrio sp. CAU 1672]
MNRVWVTGDAVVDLIPDSDGKLLKCPGGAPANVAVAIARLGGNTAFFGCVGQDPFGNFMNNTLIQEGVNTQYLRKDPAQRTSTVVVDLDDSGERSFTFMVKPSADQFMQVDDIPPFSSGEWLHVCSIALANEPSRSSTLEAIKRIKHAGGYISFDPNLREEVWADPTEIKPVVNQVIQLADVIKFSEEELMFLTDTNSINEGLDKLQRHNNTLVLVTQGAKGVLMAFGDSRELLPGQKVTPIDTTGAGDAFVGGLLAKLAQHTKWTTPDTIYSAIRWANGCGALATTAKGAMSALPNAAELADFVRA